MIYSGKKEDRHHGNYIKYRDYYISYSRKHWRSYYQKHKSKIIKQRHAFYKNNRLRILQKVREYYTKNRVHKSLYNKDYRLKNLDRLRKKDRSYYWSNLDQIKRYRRKNSKMIAEKARKYRENLKQEVLIHYSNKSTPRCKNCGKTDGFLLTIDHVNNDGAKERKRIGKKGGTDFYLWLKRNNYPYGYQVLCYNCNWLRRYKPRETVRFGYSRKIKVNVLSHYADSTKDIRCSFCSEEKLELLTIDHINGQGHAEQERLKLKGTEYYRYLIKNNYPSGFRILCLNCNVSAARLLPQISN